MNSSDFSLNTIGSAKKSSSCPAIKISTGHQQIHSQWPIQLALVSPNAPFLYNADVLLVADCVPFAYADFHKEFLKNNTLLVACPKLDDFNSHLEKMASIMEISHIKSITVLHMDIPCCSGLIHMAQQAVLKSGKEIPIYENTITRK